ncbi:MAG: hypothetical protein VYE64_09410 [Planctomycetota bacterium]|nr:hypothetical protein [Planctomycetota bacterium]
MKKFSLLMLLMVVGCGYGVNSKLPREMTQAELAKSLVGVWELKWDSGSKSRIEFLYNPHDFFQGRYLRQGEYRESDWDEENEARRKFLKDYSEPGLWSLYDGDSATVRVGSNYTKAVRVETK